MRLAIYTSNKANRMRKAIETGSSEFVHDICLFFSDDPNTQYLQEFLEERNIVYMLVPFGNTGEKEKSRKKFSDIFLAALRKYEIDYVYCNGNHLLSGDILKEYKNKIINFHGALLPTYKGISMLDKMVKENEFLVGTTAMFIDEGCDTGPIIMEAVIPLIAFEKCGYDIVLDTQIVMMHKIYELLKANRIHIINNVVNISDADYNSYSIFPKV